MDEFKITATQDTDLTELERIRINMAYQFYYETMKQRGSGYVPKEQLEAMAQNSTTLTDTLLKALGYEME